jgi:hypothetical protein
MLKAYAPNMARVATTGLARGAQRHAEGRVLHHRETHRGIDAAGRLCLPKSTRRLRQSRAAMHTRACATACARNGVSNARHMGGHVMRSCVGTLLLVHTAHECSTSTRHRRSQTQTDSQESQTQKDAEKTERQTDRQIDRRRQTNRYRQTETDTRAVGSIQAHASRNVVLISRRRYESYTIGVQDEIHERS